jgi:hypothetical protein
MFYFPASGKMPAPQKPYKDALRVRSSLVNC